MPCKRPLSASLYHDPLTHKRGVHFGKTPNYDTAALVQLPCGQCIFCRLERSRRWAVRLMHEAQMHERSCFITLTYSPKNVPANGSLDVDHFQRFMKRLRRGSTVPLRFFHCGEYGEENARPHYHALIFGEDFAADRQLLETTKRGDELFTSARLSEVWNLGHASIGRLTFESAAYVARYALKKITGKKAAEHYGDRKPEYITMSKKPGIGGEWFKRWSSDVYPSDSVVMRGKEMLPPPYYDKLLERIDPTLFARIKKERTENSEALKWDPETTPTRQYVHELVKAATVSQTLKRKL